MLVSPRVTGGVLCGVLCVSYTQVIVDYPLAVLVGCAMLLLGCSFAGLFIGPLPDFSDPLLVSVKRSHTHEQSLQSVILQSP